MKKIKRAIVTGAAGFTGTALVNTLLSENIEVFAIVRPNSINNQRLSNINPNLHIIELFPENYNNIHYYINKQCDIFFHLMWTEGATFEKQSVNIKHSLNAITEAKICGCYRFICTGSQAEYGIMPPQKTTTEDINANPITPYGIAKLEACKETKKYASMNNIEWIWARIFSLIGKFEPKTRMLPSLFINLSENKTSYLSSCRQNWDYLDVHDAANALLALGEKGCKGEIYNIAKGNYRPLKEYTEFLKNLISPDSIIIYGEDPNPFISLSPSINKIKNDTGWLPERSFIDSIEDYKKTLI